MFSKYVGNVPDALHTLIPHPKPSCDLQLRKPADVDLLEKGLWSTQAWLQG